MQLSTAVGTHATYTVETYSQIMKMKCVVAFALLGLFLGCTLQAVKSEQRMLIKEDVYINDLGEMTFPDEDFEDQDDELDDNDVDDDNDDVNDGDDDGNYEEDYQIDDA